MQQPPRSPDRGWLRGLFFSGWGLRDVVWAVGVALLLSQYMNLAVERDVAVKASSKPSDDGRRPQLAAGGKVDASHAPAKPAATGGEGGAPPLLSAAECTEAQMNETVLANEKHFKYLHSHASREVKRVTFTMASWLNQGCARRAAPHVSPTNLDHVLVLIMGGSFHRARSVAVRATWAQHFKHTVLMGDFEDAELRMITLPELYNQTGYDAAQQRSLRSLLYGVKNLPEGIRWIIMVDDDTWLNPTELHHFLYPLEWRMPVVLGHTLEDPGIGLTAYIAGGSGMLLSLPAARILAANLYTTCYAHKAYYNDMTLGECAWTFGIPQVFSPLFDFHGRVLQTNNRELRITESMSYVSVHKVYSKPGEEKMREYYGYWEQRVKPWWEAARKAGRA